MTDHGRYKDKRLYAWRSALSLSALAAAFYSFLGVSARGAQPERARVARLEESGAVRIVIGEAEGRDYFQLQNAGATRQRVAIHLGDVTRRGARTSAILSYVLKPFATGERLYLDAIGRKGAWIVSWNAEEIAGGSPAHGSRAASPFFRAPPDYPAACALEADATARITISFDLSENGRLRNIQTTPEKSCLGDAAAAAAAQWRYAPALRDGVAVRDLEKEAVVTFERTD